MTTKKHFIFIIIGLCILLHKSFSQADTTDTHNQTFPILYVGASAGLNNQVGTIGCQIDWVLDNQTLIGLGYGRSKWGNIAAVSIQQHPSHFKKIYYGIGLTLALGKENFVSELELYNLNLDSVTMNLKPVTALNLFLGNSWLLGKKTRLFIEAGYALPLTEENSYYYIVDPYVRISDLSRKALHRMAPGGFMLSAGFAFGIGNVKK